VVQIHPPATNAIGVRSGDIGNRTFRRHRLHFWPEGVLQGLQGFFLQINIAEIEIHKTDQPNAVVDLLDTDGLARKGYAEVDLLVIEAKTSSVITLIRSSRLRLSICAHGLNPSRVGTLSSGLPSGCTLNCGELQVAGLQAAQEIGEMKHGAHKKFHRNHKSPS
jgi:hypothetical protein